MVTWNQLGATNTAEKKNIQKTCLVFLSIF